MSQNPPIFITGRFRAGTSFLWQLFDRLPQFCAWYEPLHPQLLAHVKHIKPKPDHVGIDDYWCSYREHPDFSKNYSPDFAHNGLWLEAASEYPELKAYIQDLVELSGSQWPVLQFNRMDFRLSWLKVNFPGCKIIHIKRNPLQLWHSQRKHLPQSDRDNPSASDAYELMQWSVALSHLFPFLSKRNHDHAFFRCYVIQQLSDQMAAQWADVCLSLEHDVFETDAFSHQLEQLVGLSADQWLQAKAFNHVPTPHPFDETELLALMRIMAEADTVLEESGLGAQCGKKILQDIINTHPEFWQQQKMSLEWHNDEMLHALASQQTELTQLMAAKNELADQLKRNH